MHAYYGHVYENGAEGRKPLPAVRVTDGRHVTRTGEDGAFVLPGYEKTRFITVTTPSGYRAQARYLPADERQAAYDFDLYPCENKDKHTFIHISDTEVGKQGVGAWAEDTVQVAREMQAAFIMHTGDICYEDGLRTHIQGLNSDSAGLPVYYAIGNHDFVKGSYGEWLFESLYGPTWYSFEVGNMHYIVTPIERGLDYPSGYTREDLYLWLKHDLEQKPKQMKLIVFNHGILNNEQDYVFAAEGYSPLVLRAYGLAAWIYGHCHYHYLREREGVLSISTGTPDKGGCDHSPMAFRMVQVDGDGRISTGLHYCRVPEHVTIAYPQEGGHVRRRPGGELSLSVNAYSSNSFVSEVSGTLTCPGVAGELIFRPSGDWNWTAGIPFDTHCCAEYALTVNAVFSDGKTAASTCRFTVTEDDIGEPMSIQWCRNIGASILFSAPVLTENYVIVGASDDIGTGKAGVWVFDKADGTLLWHYPTKNSIKNRVLCCRGVILAQDIEGGLYALSLDTGALVWQKSLSFWYFNYLSEGMAESDGILYAGTGETLGAYRIDTGEQLWLNNSWRRWASSLCRWTIAQDVLVAGTDWGGLYGMDRRTGALLWKHTENSLRYRSTEGCFHGGKLYIAASSELLVLDIHTGEILRQRLYPEFNFEVGSASAITGNKWIVATANAGVIAVNPDTLELLWHFHTLPALCGSAPYTSPPAQTVESSLEVDGDRVLFGASDGRVYALGIEDGLQIAALEFGAPIFTVSAVRDGRLAAADLGGSIYLINV